MPKSAAREAEEVLAPVTAERRAAVEDRAAAAADRAATEAALVTREAKIIQDSESIRRTLDEHRQRAEARERALEAREAEVTRREDLAAQADLDLSRNREELETHEGTLAQTMASHEAEVADRKSTRLNSSHSGESRMPSSA